MNGPMFNYYWVVKTNKHNHFQKKPSIFTTISWGMFCWREIAQCCHLAFLKTVCHASNKMFRPYLDFLYWDQNSIFSGLFFQHMAKFGLFIFWDLATLKWLFKWVCLRSQPESWKRSIFMPKNNVMRQWRKMMGPI
jgi:hypothetical protein